MPVILAIWEAEIGRIQLLGQSGQIVFWTQSPKQPEQNGLEMWLRWYVCKSEALSSNSSPTKKIK
jgi:hypothetical protein